ncbi:uncharacterized protein MELLADRAFT_64807 [Melampsora larici-populina 98AG31]|uniref:Secreted protein n=1 Tax=Melampsora larici-populina (strain 98AG31 / pathotype 3-4-7) TaxID=747676 RepID=F4RSV6_MELLP|nr:uncharacterized protein MELLADRAFT_64807 [Melampsora larici-populina 98AG31]EGG04539.1 secreted protein [Melampsora larici-populina 98AG31]
MSLSLFTSLVLSLCIFLPNLILADHPAQSAHVYWRWKDEGNSNAWDHSIFTGHATITWTRKGGCLKTGETKNFITEITTDPVQITAETKNKSGDYMDPKSVVHWAHGKDTSAGACDAYSRSDFWVYNRDRTQRMKIRLPDICNDNNCKGPDKERPNVQCLKGPKGRVVMYLDKWIDECFER